MTRAVPRRASSAELYGKSTRLWDELFPAEQARIVQLLVERVEGRLDGIDIRLRANGLSGLVRKVAGAEASGRAAA